MTLSVYIHFPFCLKKCPYCDFVSYVNPPISKEDYCDSILKELDYFAQFLPQSTNVESVYLGGGTPSLFEPILLEKILTAIKTKLGLVDSAEITIEINPRSIEKEKMKDAFRHYLAMGINRASIGIQSTRDDILQKLGRIHNAEDGKITYEFARWAGFSNINLDLIFGVPEQNAKEWLADLSEAISWMPEHISAYMLKAPPDWVTPDEDILGTMYLSAVELLEKAGIHQYEVSNFARLGKKCAHNLVYWYRESSYLGLGASAHSFFTPQLLKEIAGVSTYLPFESENTAGVRASNEIGLEAYAEKVARTGNGIANVEKLDKEQELCEKIMLGLRLKEGIIVSEISSYLREDRQKLLAELMAQMEKDKLCEQDSERLRLTPRGMLLADEISARLSALLDGSSNLTFERGKV